MNFIRGFGQILVRPHDRGRLEDRRRRRHHAGDRRGRPVGVLGAGKGLQPVLGAGLMAAFVIALRIDTRPK